MFGLVLKLVSGGRESGGDIGGLCEGGGGGDVGWKFELKLFLLFLSIESWLNLDINRI